MTKTKKGYAELSLDQLVKADWNYKEDDQEKQEKLKANIKRNGQIENIIVRELPTGFFEVVNGNHRFSALSDLKIKKVFVYNLGSISLPHAQRIAVETNETRFETDNIKLAKLIKEIGEIFPAEELEQTMPYSQEELENFENLLNFDWNQYNNPGQAEEGSGSDSGENENGFDNTIELKVTKEIFEAWENWKEKLKNLTEIDNESRAFEYAIIEALNIPDESLNS